jgi:hypothetical protein
MIVMLLLGDYIQNKEYSFFKMRIGRMVKKKLIINFDLDFFCKILKFKLF